LVKKLPALPLAAVILVLALMGAAPDQGAMKRLADTEREFAQVCAQKGIRDSFLQYFSDDVVTFGPKLRFGVEHLKKRVSNEPLRYKLQWLPTYGDISKAEDMGYLTGASLLEDSKGENESWRGQYFSIWTRQPEGWKVAVDFGATTPQAIFKPGAEFTRAPQSVVKLASLKSGTSIEDAERQFQQTAASTNAREAVCQSSAPYLHFYRDNEAPIESREALCKNDASGDKRDYKMLRQGVAKSGDLGFALGEYQVVGDSEGKNAGAYLHVWKRADDKWMLVASVEKVNGQ
jgi:ketosteroid isomerase-like protein